jgi:hypothetical protein
MRKLSTTTLAVLIAGGCALVEELYVQKAFTCPDSTRVLTFATTQARDDYLKVAEGFGTVTVDKGATWARVRV